MFLELGYGDLSNDAFGYLTVMRIHKHLAGLIYHAERNGNLHYVVDAAH